MAINPEETETLIDRLLDVFQSNEVAIDYGQSPDRWVEDNLPEGTEAADVARCMPQVAERLGGVQQENLARYNASHGSTAHAATQHVTHEIAYNYNTIYQQNAFVIAGEGSNVSIINGDNNHVDQTQIDNDYGVEYPEGEYPEGEYPEGEYPEGEYPEGEYPEGEYPEGEMGEDGETGEEPLDPTDPTDETDPMDPIDPVDPVDPVMDPIDEAPVDPAPVDPAPIDPVPEAPAADLAEGVEAL